MLLMIPASAPRRLFVWRPDQDPAVVAKRVSAVGTACRSGLIQSRHGVGHQLRLSLTDLAAEARAGLADNARHVIGCHSTQQTSVKN